MTPITPIRFGLAITPTADPAEIDQPVAPTNSDSTCSLCRTTRTNPATWRPGHTSRSSPAPRNRSRSCPTSPTWPCALQRCSPRPPHHSTSSPAGEWNSPSAPAGYPTLSCRWADPGARPARPSRRRKRPSRSYAWASNATEPVVLNGRHHHIGGYRPGPPPRHPIGLWVGAQRPRLLRATGRLADGWVSPLNIYVTPDAVPAAQRAIDAGAAEAGRDPDHIRRIYNVIGTIDANDGVGLNGSSRQWAETLAEWHTGLGFDTFIFWPATQPDDQLERFTHEVVPHVRDLLDQPSERPLRSAANPPTEGSNRS